MNLFKKVISALLLGGLIISCGEDDTPNPSGLSETIFSSFSATAGGDGTVVTVTPTSIGATSFSVDFGDTNSTSDVLAISEQGGSISYDYPNEVEEVTYTITVTSKGIGTDITRTQDIVVTHIITAIDSAPASPTGRRYNVFGIFTDGADGADGFVEYPIGEAAAGATVVALESGNSLLQFSRLGSDEGLITLGSSVVVADAFTEGVGATNIHFDVHSNFATGIDKLKITLYNADVATYVIDGIDLTDGTWASLEYDLATDFSAPVDQIDSIGFELGAGGTSSGHATINMDNIYLSKATSSTIINGDFTLKQDFWKWGIFTDGATDPYGSSSDGSDLNYDGTDAGEKTAGAKWSSSQSGGSLKSTSSRYAYQELALTPNADYVLEYQYAIKTGGDDLIGGKKMVGLILDDQYTDGADAVDNLGTNLGFYEGLVVEGKFGDTDGDVGTTVQIPFTANETGEIAIMFYAVTTADAYIDNVKVVVPGDILQTAPMFSSESAGGEDYLEYSFTNTSTTATSFSWDFGDGNTSTEKSPTHTYAVAGVYNVVLTATNIAGSNVANEALTITAPAAIATFAAVLQNADMQSYPTAENNNNDLVDAWTIDPDNTFNDGTDTPFNFWRNDDLEAWVSDPINNGGAGTTDKGSSSGTDADGASDRSLKFDSSGERAYQPFEVEEGIEYTITANVKSETTPITDVEGTFYILGAEPADETDLASIAIATVPVTATALDTWQEVSFSFTVNSTFTFSQSRVDENATDILTSTDQEFVIFYFVPTNTVLSANEVFITDIVIDTPGFD